jgi:hypothetical protein
MGNVFSHPGWWRNDGTPPTPPTDMELAQRVTKLETLAEKTGDRLTAIDLKLVKIETRLDTFATTFATKEDLARVEGSIRADMHKEFTAQTWRIIGAMLTFGTLLSAAVFFIARNVKP